MRIRRVFVNASVVLLGASVWGLQVRPEPNPRAAVDSVRAVPLVRVRLTVRNTTSEEIFVPVCGYRAGTPSLCTLATHLQVMTQQVWKPAAPAKDRGILGGTPMTDGIRVRPGAESSFEWEFASSVFTIDTGARVRLLLDTWHDAPLKDEKPVLSIPSEEFKIPAFPGGA